MFQGVGNLALGSISFTGTMIDFCSSEFRLSEQLENYTYDYLDSEEQLLKVAPESARPQSKKWQLDLNFSLLNHKIYSLLESFNGTTTDNFTPFNQFFAKGSDTVSGNNIRAYNTSKCRIESVSGGTFPNADPTDIIFVVVDGDQESRAFSNFSPDQIFSFVGVVYLDDGNLYYLNIPEMQPLNRISFTTGQDPKVSYELIRKNGDAPFRIFKLIT